MSVWMKPEFDLPKEDEMVLAIKEKKDGSRDYCLAHCIPEWKYTNPITKEVTVGPYWVCSGNNNIIYWTRLPKIPE